ncbi:MAG: Co2+/Mg2+ efflux protein ApaG [Gemmatimonadota bacterium]
MRPPFFYRETHGIRITVHPLFLGDQSDPEAHRFVFAYFVRIENVGTMAARLLRRRWRIHDSMGEDSEVEGDGVVGQQPLIPPGGVHEYQSFCVLKSPAGHMEGEYYFEKQDGGPIQAAIPRFILDATAGAESN